MTRGSQYPEAYLSIITRREIRDYSAEPLERQTIERILQAGRATGSSRNRQPWRFYVVTAKESLDEIAETVAAPENIRSCAAAVAIVMTRKRGFDSGRVFQNMALAAWSLGVASCPNTVMEKERCSELLDLEPEWNVASIISLGWPAHPIGPHDDDPDAILQRIDRKPLEELTHWVDD